MDKLILSILIFIQREFKHFVNFSDIYIYNNNIENKCRISDRNCN